MTGGTGFLGAYIIADLISHGYPVRAIRRSAKLPKFISPEIMARVEWVDGDILDVVSLDENMKGVDAVIHSAAVVSFNAKDRERMYEANVEGTINVVNLALENNIARFIHISSVAAVGRTADGSEVDELKKWEDNKLNTHYAKSKYRSELEVWRAIGEGLDAVILNPSTILGYGDWHSSSSAIFRKVYDEFPYYAPGLNGFVAVEDVARVAVLLLEKKEISGERYIVNGDNWPFRQLMDTMAEGFQKKKPAKAATPALLGLAWRMEKIKSLFTGNRPLLTKESARVSQSRTRFSNRKLLVALPEFSFTPLDEAIRNACKRYIGEDRRQP